MSTLFKDHEVTPICKLLYDDKVFPLLNRTIDNLERVEAEVTNIITIGDFKEGDHILDLGCGQGNHTLEFAKRGYSQIIGLDISPALVTDAIHNQSTQPETYSAIFYLGDGMCMNHFQNATFDKILLLGNGLSYLLLKDRPPFLKEAARVLKKDGKIILDSVDIEYLVKNFNPKTWNRMDQKHYVLHERELPPDNRKTITRSILMSHDKGQLLERTYSERVFGFDELSNLLEEAGFSSVTAHESKDGRYFISATPTPDFSYDTTNYYPIEIKQTSDRKGVFAARDIRIGEVVLRFSGPIMPYEKVPLEEQLFVCRANGLYVTPVTAARYVTHSCDPNCVTNSLRELLAKKPIKHGEELSYCRNLGDTWEFWDQKWSFECTCGTEKCQKVIDCYIDKFGNKLIEPVAPSSLSITLIK